MYWHFIKVKYFHAQFVNASLHKKLIYCYT